MVVGEHATVDLLDGNVHTVVLGVIDQPKPAWIRMVRLRMVTSGNSEPRPIVFRIWRSENSISFKLDSFGLVERDVAADAEEPLDAVAIGCGGVGAATRGTWRASSEGVLWKWWRGEIGVMLAACSSRSAAEHRRMNTVWLGPEFESNQ